MAREKGTQGSNGRKITLTGEKETGRGGQTGNAQASRFKISYLMRCTGRLRMLKTLKSQQAVGAYRVRSPIKPVILGEVATLAE